jgi:hypothetical protein
LGSELLDELKKPLLHQACTAELQQNARRLKNSIS